MYFFRIGAQQVRASLIHIFPYHSNLDLFFLRSRSWLELKCERIRKSKRLIWKVEFSLQSWKGKTETKKDNLKLINQCPIISAPVNIKRSTSFQTITRLMGLWIVGWKASEGKEGEGEGRRGKRMVAGWISCKTSRGCPPHYRNRQKVCTVLRQKNSLIVYGKTINNNITT